MPNKFPPADGSPYDIVVYGGTASGVVAAIQAARMGQRVLVVEPLRHLGGMTTSGLGLTDMGDRLTQDRLQLTPNRAPVPATLKQIPLPRQPRLAKSSGHSVPREPVLTLNRISEAVQ